MVVVRKSIPELIDFFNSTLGSDMTYLCKCILTDYNQWSMIPVVNEFKIEQLVDMPIQWHHSAYDEAVAIASGVKQ